jgi:hypothetical protein
VADWMTATAEVITGQLAEVVQQRRDGIVREEEDFTSAMLGQIRSGLQRVHVGGVAWEAAVLRKQTEEPHLGADVIGVLEVELPDYRVTKGFLAQAKLIGDRRHVRKTKLLAQCRDMLVLTPSSYVFLYDLDAVRVVPALAVVANGGEPRNLHAFSVMEFFFEHFACFLGDRRLGRPLGRMLDAMAADLDAWRREFRAANLLALSAARQQRME